MAGAGYKLFNTGDVLTAAQVNTYLQEQAVMRFATTAARTTALAGVLSEGMVSYIDATDTVEVYNGSAWVSVAGASSPLTTKGDLYTYSTTNARLAVGNNGETLIADNSQTTGLRYNPPVASLANPVINGGFDIWQRGTSVATGTTFTYSADRWQSNRGALVAGMTVSRQATGDTTNLPNIQYAARVQRDSGNTSTQPLYFYQSFETVNSIPFAGKTVTLTFYARAGANYSSASSGLAVNFRSGTGTDQNISGGYTGSANVVSQTATLTTTWQRFAYTGTIGATATELSTEFAFTPVGTAGANDWFEVTGVQIDVGTWTASTAPSFRRSGGTLQGELAACQRYYWRSTAGSTAQGFAMAQAISTTQAYAYVQNPVPMRLAPTSIEFSTLALASAAANAQAVTALTLDFAGSLSSMIKATVAANLVAGNASIMYANSSTAAYLAMNAEL